jgi:SMI1-KNR4 cell-wall
MQGAANTSPSGTTREESSLAKGATATGAMARIVPAEAAARSGHSQRSLPSYVPAKQLGTRMASEPWLVGSAATLNALNALRSAVPSLPASYLALLSRGNGGEVSLSVSPLVLCLDSAEDALAHWESGTYTMKGVFVFGGNGGGELLALDMRKQEPWPVICFDPIDPEGSVEMVADDFSSLLTLTSMD